MCRVRDVGIGGLTRAQIQFNLKDAEPLDFNVLQERWQTYKLSDGSKIKIRLTLISVWRLRSQHNPLTGESLYTWSAPNVLSLISFPENLRGEPTTTQITPEVMAQSIDESVDFELLGKHDEWNVYNLSDGTILRLRLNLTGIMRTRLHAQDGGPVYSISTGPPNFRLKVSSKLIRKQATNVPRSVSTPAYA